MSVYDLPQHYDLKRFDFMKPQGPHMPITESYVSIPPALWIRDEQNALWTLGFDYNEQEWRGGRWEYDIVRNGVKTGDWGRIIEYRGHKLRIWGAEGWRTWTGRSFV
jgi:hypothetical protein